LAAAVAASAATPDVPATWNDGTTDGWYGFDVNNESARALNNPSTYLELALGEQYISCPEAVCMMADDSASQGHFTGDFVEAGVERILFKFFAAQCLPKQARLYICARTTNRKWYVPINLAAAGQWTQLAVPLDYSAGWTLDTAPTQEKFDADIRDISWVGVRIERNDDAGAQSYGLDDFVLASDTYGSGGDKSSGQQKTLTGEGDAPSIKPTLMPSAVGIAISWPSADGKMYDIWRTTDMKVGFVDSKPIATVPSATGADATIYEDMTAVGNGPYYYRVTEKTTE